MDFLVVWDGLFSTSTSTSSYFPLATEILNTEKPYFCLSKQVVCMTRWEGRGGIGTEGLFSDDDICD